MTAQPLKRGLTALERRSGRYRTTKPNAQPSEAQITLTEDQNRALEALLRFESPNSTQSVFVLSGAAGTGKTTVLQHYLKATTRPAILTAPTNKAVRVLAEMAAAHGLAVPCCTLHKLLNLAIRNDAQEKYCVEKTLAQPLPDFEILIVDECSMVGDRQHLDVPGLYTQLKAFLARHAYVKTVFVGDPCQLPPVKDGALSPTFDAAPNPLHLSEIVRQAHDNPIIALATYIRDQMQARDAVRPELQTDGFRGVYTTTDPQEFEDLITTAYLETPDHPTLYKALAYRNKTTARINAAVRRDLFGADTPDWQVGERYVATQPVVDWVPSPRGYIPDIKANTDEDALLTDVSPTAPVPGFERYETLLLSLTGQDGPFPALVPHWDARPRWAADLANYWDLAVKRQVSWQAYWACHDAFAHLKPHYAMTAHRSQGSTYQNVFVDVRDILSNPNGHWEALRCLYTAITRASDMVYLLD